MSRRRLLGVAGPLVLALVSVATAAFSQTEPPPPNVIIVETPAAPPPPPAVEASGEVLGEADPPPPPPRQRPRTRLYGWLAGGYAVQRVFAIGASGYDVSGSLGADFGSLSVGAEVDVVSAITDGGLHTTTVTFGPVVEGHFDRIRVGGMLRIDSYDVGRVTNGGDLFSLGIGLGAHLTLDLVPFDDDHGALFLMLKGNVDAFGDAALYGAFGGAGVRF